MKAVIQRVQEAKVVVEGKVISEVKNGLLTLLAIEKNDDLEALRKLIQKIVNLRIFEDDSGKMNLSVKDINGEHLMVSQFTLAGDCKKGNRPSFVNAEEPNRAKEIFEMAVQWSRELDVSTVTGQFQADMKVHLVNDGPVTFHLP